MKDDYYSIGLYDLDSAALNYKFSRYNTGGTLAQQAIEKLLKSVVPLVCTTDVENLQRGHNLVVIYKAIHENLSTFVLDLNKLRYIKDFYYDTRYPGENFEWITKEECSIACDYMYTVLEVVNNVRTLAGLDIIEKEKE